MLSFPTAIGDCGLEWGADGITRVHMPRVRTARPRPARPAVDPAVDTPAYVREVAELIVRLLEGEPVDLRDIPVSHGERVAPFARRVYAATRSIRPGETVSYGELARRLGDPGALPARPSGVRGLDDPAAPGASQGLARAVGAALAANPTPIIVPCHRVLAADGSLHGFSAPGGIATKRRLLEIEGAPGFAQQPLFV